MKKTYNRGISFLLICIMLLAFVTPLQSVANANDAPVNYLYNFAVLYDFFNTGTYDSDWHSRANVDSNITYERVKEYNKGFDRHIVQGESSYAVSNYSIPLPKVSPAEWCYDSQSSDPKLNTSNCNKDVGIMMTPSGSWLSLRIQVPEDGAYAASSAMRFQPDSGLVDVYLAPESLADEKMSEDYRIDTVDAYRASNGAQSEMHEHTTNLMLRAGEYLLTYKLAGNSTQDGAPKQVWAGVGGFVLDRTGSYEASADKLELPTASPAPGIYTEEQVVTLNSTTADSTIYYTIDGSQPTQESRVYTSPIPVNETTTIKAFAAKNGMESSKVATLVYEINFPPVKLTMPTASVETGTVFEDTLTVSLHTDEEDAVIYYTTNGMPPTTSSIRYTSPITLNKTTTIKAIVTKSGMESSGAAIFQYQKKGEKKVPAPLLFPQAQIFDSSLDITIICVEEGAQIYYTTDGRTPTTSSNLYDGTPIYLTASTYLSVIAVKDGMQSSDVVSALYTKQSSTGGGGGMGGGGGNAGSSGINKQQVAMPTASLPSGTYSSTQTLSLSCTTTGAKIYYTTDGTAPTSSDTPYTAPITVDASMEIRAIAYKSGMKNSSVLTLKYTIQDKEENGSQNQERENPFDDVSKDDWFYEAVLHCNEKGWIRGISENLMAPNSPVTRGMFVTILNRMSGENAEEYSHGFIDVKKDDWFNGSVAWASAANIANGVGNSRFAPNDVITREQLCAMLMRYLQYLELSLPDNGVEAQYSDEAEISAWALEDVNALTRAGIIQGKDMNRFDPKGSATRAEIAAVIYRITRINT